MSEPLELTDDNQPALHHLIGELHRNPILAQQVVLLQQQPGYSERTVQLLFGYAIDNLSSNPQLAGELAELCVTAAAQDGWEDLAGQASYLRAQVHAMRAEFEPALRLIEAARNHFRVAGNTLAMLRTDIGRMAVMRDQGRCHEVIVSGVSALQQVDSQLGAQSLVAARMRNNLGLCCEQQGLFDEAMRYWHEAESAFRSNDAIEEASHAQNNRGLIYLRLGQARDALAQFETAAHVFAENDLTLNLAQARINSSQAHFMLGDPGQGLACLEQARALIEPLGASADNLVLLLDTADAYQDLNLQTEAIELYQRVVPELQTAGMSDEQLRALLGLSSALIATGRADQAVTLLNELSAAALNGPDTRPTPTLCRLLLNRASALSATGREADATRQALQALDQASTHGWQRQLAEAHVLFAGLPSTAASEIIAHLEQARQIAQQSQWPSLRTQVLQQLGHVYLHSGRKADAERVLQTAVADIEQSRATLAEDQFRIAFFKNKANAFDDLVQLYLQRSQDTSYEPQHTTALQSAFAYAERAKSRALLDAMTDKAPSSVFSQTAKSISAVNSVTPTSDEVCMQLDDRTVLLYYYVCGDDISAFILSQQHTRLGCVRGLSQLSKIAPLLDSLNVQLERFLAGAEFVSRFAKQLEVSAQNILKRLYQELIAPVEQLIQEHALARDVSNNDTPLVIVPHGVLHAVPFHALHDGASYLIERYEISYAPSASTFLISQKRKALEMGKALVVGVEDASIPVAMVEAERVMQQLQQTHPQAQLLAGAQATVQQVQAHLAGCDIVHLACHGMFRHDNPLFSALYLHDTKLTAADAAHLNLNSALVTLSACESGRSQVIAGDEMLGLPRAMLGAGASSVLVSLWLVHDETTAALMQGWYALLRQGIPRVQALRTMQRHIMRQQPHPYYWAPFVLMGQR